MKIGFASADWSRSVFDKNNHPVWGGSGWARLGQYENLLPHTVVKGVLCSRNGVFGVMDWDENHHFDLDVIVMQRVMFDDVAHKIRSAVAAGQIVINDVDDWYWGLSPQNQAWMASHPKYNPEENRNFYRTIIANSTGVIVSTKYLQKNLQPWVKCPITIIGNYVDIDRFTPHTHTDTDVPTVGWVGSTSHRSGDLEIMRTVLPPLLRAGKIRLHHSGHLEGARTFAEAINVPVESVTTKPMVAPENYPSLLSFDIGIVPLTDISFNHAKSYIKGLEYAAAGIPFVASALPEYVALSEQFGIGRTANKSRKFAAALEVLRNPDVRKAEAAKNLENVKMLDISVGAVRLNDYLESLV